MTMAPGLACWTGGRRSPCIQICKTHLQMMKCSYQNITQQLHFPQYAPWAFHCNRFRRKQVTCAYGGNGTTDYASAPIDITAKVRTEKIVVLGGNGFVGSAICKAAVAEGIEVVSLNRTGRPSYDDSWVEQVLWVPGNVFYADWDGLLNGATAVVSAIGGFGTNEEMEKINGEANVVAVEAASRAGIPRFVYISVHDYKLPSFVLDSGYFSGKRKAEQSVLSKFPNTGTVLRPGFIYGKRRVNGVDVPLDVIGRPLESFLLTVDKYVKPLNSLPGSDLVLTSPVSVDDVAGAAINAVLDDSMFGVFNIEQIKEAAAALKSRAISV